MEYYRPTFAEIDLRAIRYNINQIRKIIDKDTKILGVVKADAYGHGMKEISEVLVDEGIDYLGVSSLDEAKILREFGIKTNIIVLGAILPREADGVLKYNVVQTVSDLNIAKILSLRAARENKYIKVHIKIDTGMGRLGFWHDEALGYLRKIKTLRNILIEGIFTHFPSAEDNKRFTQHQIRSFSRLVEGLNKIGLNIPLKHTSNSMALIGYKEAHMNMVRPGLIIYGLYPRRDLARRLKLKPALQLKTKVVHVKKVLKGQSISYGRTYIAEKATVIATIPVGYGDGYSRHLSNRGYTLIKNQRAPIVGRVCMDMCMVDVGHLRQVKAGDEVVLIGRQGREFVTVEEVAQLAGTIPYEVVCNIGNRVPRLYINTKIDTKK